MWMVPGLTHLECLSSMVPDANLSAGILTNGDSEALSFKLLCMRISNQTKKQRVGAVTHRGSRTEGGRRTS